MDNFTSMFTFINLIIGVFTIYSAITGRGPVYKNDYPESIKADTNRLLRIVCWIVGPLFIAMAALDYFGYNMISLYLMVPVTITIIVYLVIFFKKYYKIAKGK